MTYVIDPPMTVGVMRPDDLGPVAGIDARCTPQTGWPTPDEVDLGRADRCYLVARRGEAVVGFAGALLAPGAGQILTVAVDPAHRRRGIGRELVTALVGLVRGRGAQEVSLEVRAGNHAARGLYRDLGFVAVGTRERYYPDGEDALVMRKG